MYVCTSNKSNVDHINLSYRVSHIQAMEMQSKTNSTIYENVEKDKSEIEMSEDQNSVHAYEVFNRLSVEQNEGIYEDVEKDGIRLSETTLSENPDSMHACETFKSHSPGQTDAVYENPSADDEEITKAELSNPASTFQPKVRENPYVLDTSTENTSSTTT